jgi:hypothetical protein
MVGVALQSGKRYQADPDLAAAIALNGLWSWLFFGLRLA